MVVRLPPTLFSSRFAAWRLKCRTPCLFLAVHAENNYLGQLVEDLFDCVKQKVQVNMNRLKSDCSSLSKAIDA